MKIDDKGNILEATRAEIVRHYYMGDLKDLFTLDEYEALLKYQGARIVEKESSNDGKNGA